VTTAVAHPNIALAKYWGKRAGAGNVPAVPSLSVTLAGLSTRTTVTFGGRGEDVIVLNGIVQPAGATARARALIDSVRAAAAIDGAARVESENDFPTASGLASSASGFAALALAATRAAGLDTSVADVADLARRGSASAARSLFGGFCELVPDEAGARAAQVAPEGALPLRVLVCVVTEDAKDVPSSVGMEQTRAESPYYAAWLDAAPRLFADIRAAVVAGDLAKTCELSERSALAMHASALAAGVVYFRPVTLDVYARVRALRAAGRTAFATMDAGPHVKVLTSADESEALARELGAVPGVLRVLVARPGPGAFVP
jgi:diphosphomevalonate decarboxylase